MRRMGTWVSGEDEGNEGGELDHRPEVTSAPLLQFKSCSGMCGISLEMWYFWNDCSISVLKFEPLTHKHHIKICLRVCLCRAFRSANVIATVKKSSDADVAMLLAARGECCRVMMLWADERQAVASMLTLAAVCECVDSCLDKG